MKTATVRLTGEGLRFDATTGSGHQLVLDSRDGDAGPRPAELLVVALAGCTAMDVISILRKKRQPVTDYAVRVEGLQREEHPSAFLAFRVRHSVHGAVDVEAVRRAIELSATRYCAVGATLSSGALTIHHGYVIERPDGEIVTGEVCVTGPRRELVAAVPA